MSTTLIALDVLQQDNVDTTSRNASVMSLRSMHVTHHFELLAVISESHGLDDLSLVRLRDDLEHGAVALKRRDCLVGGHAERLSLLVLHPQLELGLHGHERLEPHGPPLPVLLLRDDDVRLGAFHRHLGDEWYSHFRDVIFKVLVPIKLVPPDEGRHFHNV